MEVGRKSSIKLTECLKQRQSEYPVRGPGRRALREVGAVKGLSGASDSLLEETSKAILRILLRTMDR